MQSSSSNSLSGAPRPNRRAVALGGLAAAGAAALAGPAAAQARVERASPGVALTPLPFVVGGRVVSDAAGLTYQWPGVYF